MPKCFLRTLPNGIAHIFGITHFTLLKGPVPSNTLVTELEIPPFKQYSLGLHITFLRYFFPKISWEGNTLKLVPVHELFTDLVAGREGEAQRID